MMKTQVLIVEDDLSQKPLWELILKRQFREFSLDWAVNFEEAKRLWQKSIASQISYDLVIADIFLAGPGTGIDLVELKKSLNLHVPFLLVTSVAESDIREAYPLLAEDATLLTKPLNIPRCDRTLEKLFWSENQKRFQRSEIVP